MSKLAMAKNMEETIDLSPNWDNVAKYFDQKAKEARQEGKEKDHTFYTELAEKAENEELTKKELYNYYL